jgi:hypothetical protein
VSLRHRLKLEKGGNRDISMVRKWVARLQQRGCNGGVKTEVEKWERERGAERKR